MTKTLTSTPIVVPEAVRRKAGLRRGEQLEFRVSGRAITIVPKVQGGPPEVQGRDDEYTPAERRAIDRGIAQSEKEYQQGKVAGPFATVEEFLTDLHRADIFRPGVKTCIDEIKPGGENG